MKINAFENISSSPPSATVEHLTARQIQSALDSFAQSGELRRGPFRMYKGLFANPFDLFRVPPGVIIVAVYDGDCDRPELLENGPYHPRIFPMIQQVDLYLVNTRQCIYAFPSAQDFTLSYRPTVDAPVTPIGVRLDVSVDYQVEAPELIALKLQTPLLDLHQAVVDEASRLIARIGLDELFDTDRLKTAIARGLEASNLVQEIGFRIRNAHIADVKLDPKMLASLQSEWIKIQEATGTAKAQAILFDEQTREEKERIQAFGLLGALQSNPMLAPIIIEAFRQGTTMLNPVDLPKLLLSPQAAPQKVESLPALLATPKEPTLTVLEQLNHEREILSVQGVAVAIARLGDAYQVVVAFRTTKGQSLTLTAQCCSEYPNTAPTLNLMVNQQPIPCPVSWQSNSTFLTFVQDLRVTFS